MSKWDDIQNRIKAIEETFDEKTARELINKLYGPEVRRKAQQADRYERTKRIQKQEEEKAVQERKLQTKKTPTDVQIFGPDVIGELEGVLEEIRASVDVYPKRQPNAGETGDRFQYIQEVGQFHSNKPQEVSFEKYPKLQNLFKSFIHQMILEGKGKQPYEPSNLTRFVWDLSEFYREDKQLATEGAFDVNLISELGFGSSAEKIKEFLKSKGVVGQRKFSRDLREVFHYFTGSFADPRLPPISAIHGGRNLQIYDILKSIPFLEPLQNRRFIVKFLYDQTDKKLKLVDASDIVPIYEQYMELSPSKARPLSQQMRELKGPPGAVRSMLDIRQQELTEQDRAINFLEHKLSQENKSKHLRVDQASIRKKYYHIKNPYQRHSIIQRELARKEKKEKEEPYPKQKLFQEVLDAIEEQSQLTDEELEELEQTEEQLDLFEQPFKLPKRDRPEEQKRLEKEEKVKDRKPPKGLKGKGLFILPREILDLIPGMGPVDPKGQPVASLDKQMKKLTG